MDLEPIATLISQTVPEVSSVAPVGDRAIRARWCNVMGQPGCTRPAQRKTRRGVSAANPPPRELTGPRKPVSCSDPVASEVKLTTGEPRHPNKGAALIHPTFADRLPDSPPTPPLVRPARPRVRLRNTIYGTTGWTARRLQYRPAVRPGSTDRGRCFCAPS